VRLTGLAPAKINLFLHVGAVQPDGYHPLSSLVAFADIGDRVMVERADRLTLTVEGPFGAGLAAEPDNLILKALRALGEAAGIGEPRVHVTLDKQLPIAAGLGGGSSDAGTALKLARDILDLDLDDAALETVAGVVGADGPMCLRARSAWAEGRGDLLTDAPDLPPLHAVLVNPGVPSSTGAVYRAFDAGPAGATERPTSPDDWRADTVIEWLATQRNDLERPALELTPAISEAIAAVAGQRDVGLVRMSGSGATVFGLFASAEAADRATAALSLDKPGWWIKRTVLAA
jgi:4-diphosphocytidyl-2-C-methyl-D-erythritol kinase